MDEFELIKTYFRPLAENIPSSLSLVDDAAILCAEPGSELVVTNDISIAGVHFFEDDPADLIARKCMRVNLSDLAAMGAKPLTYLMAVALTKPANPNWLELFSNGLLNDQIRYGLGLSGGDTVATPGPLSISITMFGKIDEGKALKRTNAKVGDDIWVSGTVGDAAVALKIRLGEIYLTNQKAKKHLLKRLNLPEPRIALGSSLIGIANSATDISDGLVADLNNICEASGVGAIIQDKRIPLSKWIVSQILETKQLDLPDIISGGGDYELVFTAPPRYGNEIQHLYKKLELRISKVGTIVNDDSVRLIDEDGQDIPLCTKGFRHF